MKYNNLGIFVVELLFYLKKFNSFLELFKNKN